MTSFPELHEWVMTHSNTVVRIEDNVIPVTGYAVPFVSESLFVEPFNMTLAYVVKSALAMGSEYIMYYDSAVAPCDVFASKEYAMGYAAGSGADFIIELATSKKIVRKQ